MLTNACHAVENKHTVKNFNSLEAHKGGLKNTKSISICKVSTQLTKTENVMQKNTSGKSSKSKKQSFYGKVTKSIFLFLILDLDLSCNK